MKLEVDHEYYDATGRVWRLIRSSHGVYTFKVNPEIYKSTIINISWRDIDFITTLLGELPA